MADYYKTIGFVVAKNDLRDADQIFSIYTKDFGKLDILGRAIRKIKSKLRSGIDLFYLSEIEFIQGKHYKTLTGASSIEKFKNIKSDLDKLKIAYKILKAADSCIACEEKDDKIFSLLKEALEKLDSCEMPAMRYSLIYYYFLWNFFALLGYKIDLHNCALCRKKLYPLNLSYNFEKGGIICKRCFNNFSIISPEIVKYLRLFLEKNWDMIFRLKMTEEYDKSLDEISQNYLLHIKKFGYSNF